MVNTYDVFLNGKEIGTASLEKEGLYWKINCRCNVPNDVPYEVLLRAGEHINLGLLVKEETIYCLTRRIAMKRIGEAPLYFEARARNAKPPEVFQSIVSDAPFAYLEEIKGCKLEEKDCQVGLIIRQETPDQQIPDNDPTQEFPDESEPEQSGYPDL